ncbi:hypothetical protein [Scytonema hofmannii]|uniref:hypothetical protein n=1 Tax=Scytonema hofmannii TaxID=34078 RepID=UPI00034A9DB7|nr:hypothetical protein [Scytonema hofmannii]
MWYGRLARHIERAGTPVPQVVVIYSWKSLRANLIYADGSQNQELYLLYEMDANNRSNFEYRNLLSIKGNSPN